MLSKSQIDDYVVAHGPYLYHRAPADALPLIARQGLVPWDAEEREDVADWDDESRTTTYADSRMTPRADHVYVGGPGYVRRYDGLTLRVDLRELDLLTLDSDEDHFDQVRYKLPDWLEAVLAGTPLPPREWGSWENFVDPDCASCFGAGGDCLDCEGTGKDIYADPRDEGTLGDWADGLSATLDDPGCVAYSLACGSLAVRGAVPAAALSLDPARLSPPDLEAVDRAFADVDVALEPFPVVHEEQELVVAPDARGQFTLPDGVPAWPVSRYVSERRGARLVELFNAGLLSGPARPELAADALAPALELAPPAAEATLSVQPAL